MTAGAGGYGRRGDAAAGRPSARRPHGRTDAPRAGCPCWVVKAQDVAALVRAVKTLPDADPGRIRLLREAVRAGSYVVEPAKVAGKMVDELLESVRAR